MSSGALALPGVLWARIPHGRGAKLIASVAVATVIAGAASLIPGSSTAPVAPSSADVWVATNGNDSTCVRGDQSFPCLTFNQAYDIAQNGDTVEVASGTYAPQTILRDAKYTTSDVADVTIQPASGATVTVGYLLLGSSADNGDGPSNLTIKDISDDGPSNACAWLVWSESANVTIDNGDACNLQIYNSDHITVDGGNWGPCTSSNPSTDPCANNKIGNSTNVVWQDSYIHDYEIVPNSGAHFECMFLVSGNNITIQRNKFTNCDYYDIFNQRYDGNELQNVTVQNNWFDTPHDGNDGSNRGTAVALSPRGAAFPNYVIRYNSFNGAAEGVSVNDDDDGTVYSSVYIIGNIFNMTGCYSSAIYGYNLVIGSGQATCGTGDTAAGAADPYANSSGIESGGDWHLNQGSNPAVDMVTPTTGFYPLGDDIDGDTRPVGSARDAGADER